VREKKIAFFNDIFKYIPKTVVARDLHIKIDRFSFLMTKVEKFRMESILEMGTLCDLSEDEILSLALAEYIRQRKMAVNWAHNNTPDTMTNAH
jgi:hypothetical protein